MQARNSPVVRNASPVVRNQSPSRLSPKAPVFQLPNMTASNLSPKVHPITVRPYPTGPPPMLPALVQMQPAPPAPPPMPPATAQPMPPPPPMPPLSVLVSQSKHASLQYQVGIERAVQESRYIVAAWLEGIWRETKVEWAQPARVQWHAYMQSPSYAKWSTFVNK